MFEKVFTVKFLSVTNCFCYVSPNIKALDSGACIKLCYGKYKSTYFSISTAISNLNDNSIGISSIYARVLGIRENDSVTLVEVNKLPSIHSLTIIPLTEDDYVLMELFAQDIQNTFLNQIKVVSVDQKIVLWIGGTSVKATISNVYPVKNGCADVMTEVIIKTPKETIQKLKNSINIEQEENLICRLVNINNFNHLKSIEKYILPFNVFLSKEKLKNVYGNSKIIPLVCSMKLINSYPFPKTVYIRLCIFEDFLDDIKDQKKFNCNNIFVSNVLFKELECKMGARAVLEFVTELPKITEIVISSNTRKKEDILHTITEISKNHQLLVNAEVAMTLGKLKCKFEFEPSVKYFLIDSDNIKNIRITVNYVNNLSNENLSLESNFSNNILNQKIINEVLETFNVDEDYEFENSLITGKSGTGKSTLLSIISEKLSNFPLFVYIETIKCKALKGKTKDSIFKIFSNAFHNVNMFQPSVLILDDLHILCENVPDEEPTPNSIYFNRISVMIHNLLKSIKSNNIAIIATAESTSKLNQNIFKSRGSHLFKNQFTIGDLEKVDRIKLLNHFFDNYDTSSVDYDKLGVKTEGFVIQDIVNFATRVKYETHSDGDSGEPHLKISQEYCDTALENTFCLSFQDVQLHSPGNKDFSDVGGLDNIKSKIVKTLLWPLKYPTIFTDAPLRLQTGLLLYGHPGTGKTLLVAAAAKQCGLRLISIKGPELLSKYIGASEQSVRDVFEKARSVRPCLLFFDEFDSLAPRRGHDNTGVTDRVVNQLLTQLDGVESLNGVCVIAATSRPDLLDPALLRPGRLDQHIYCPWPEKDARLEILKVLTKFIKSEVDLVKISDITSGFSPADLQSILYTAQMLAIENISDEDDIDTSQISQEQLEAAVKKTKPSMNKDERMKLDKIYTKFQCGTLENMHVGSKATLA